MDGLWHWLLALFAFWSADPAALDAERARSAGYANVAYAALAREEKPKTVTGKPGACPPGAALTSGVAAAPAGEGKR